MELKTYIELAKIASYLKGAAEAGLDDAWVEGMFTKAGNAIETAIADDLPFELRSK